MKLYCDRYPLLRRVAIISFGQSSFNSSDGDSTMSRTSGSVPDARKSTLPPISLFCASATARCTSVSAIAADLSVTARLTSVWGYRRSGLHSFDSVLFLAITASIILRLVSMPSPVVEYLEKIICPDCSPPMRLPSTTI